MNYELPGSTRIQLRERALDDAVRLRQHDRETAARRDVAVDVVVQHPPHAVELELEARVDELVREEVFTLANARKKINQKTQNKIPRAVPPSRWRRPDCYNCLLTQVCGGGGDYPC